MKLTNRYWSKVAITPSCWLWTAATKSGKHPYGVIGRGRRSEGIGRAHVLAWEWAFGKVPAGLFVLHKCDNPRCVNPDHLFLGTALDNYRDCEAKGRAVYPPIRRGLANGNGKLTDEQVEYVRNLPPGLGNGLSALARQWGVAYSTVKRARRRKGEYETHVPEANSAQA